MDDPTKCKWKIQRGIRTGQSCQMAAREDGYCKKHKQISERQSVKQAAKKASEEKPVDTGSSSDETMLEEDQPSLTKEDKKKANTDLLKDDPIFNERVQEEETNEERSSVWLFTVNSNTVYANMSKAEKLRFRRFMEYVFDNDGIFGFITDSESPEDSLKNIDNVEVNYYFEVSSKGLLHAHGILRIKHHGFLKLELNKIRSLGKEIFGKNIHLDAPVSSDFIGAWERYAKKAGVAGRVKLG